MSDQQNPRNPSSAPATRPTSAYTSDTIFTDSAVSVDSNTTTAAKFSKYDYVLSKETATSSVSERLTQLAATAWAIEQDGNLHISKRVKLESLLDSIEKDLEEEDFQTKDCFDNEGEVAGAEATPCDNRDESDEMAYAELEKVHESLVATVSAMRLRQQEQRHLHQLSLHKFESMAQTSLAQEQRLHELNNDVRSLRQENQRLGQQNDRLHKRLELLESETTKNEVAVNAMSSAVAGLEGWINSSPEAKAHPSRTPQSRSSRKSVIRGRGRFRGRYYVDEADEDIFDPMSASHPSAQDLHEGIKAWLRGFRDVEEELQLGSAAKSIHSKEPRYRNLVEDDDWGEFESAPG